MALYLLLVLFSTISQDFTLAFPGDVSYNCGDGEEYLMCGSPCEPKCSTRYSQTDTCSEPCRPGCYCRDGLVRSSDGYCILPQHCTRPLCNENEVYSDCGSSCPTNCTNYQEVFCTQRCRRGCSCKPGFVRGPDGRCIDPYDCPLTSCGPNEEIVDCVNPCNDCKLRGRCYFQDCKKGCDCIAGYHRNDLGQCIPLGLCNKIAKSCPINEHYVQCVNTCNDCWSYGECSQTYCNPGCDCKPGYFRNQYNDCVPEYQCPISAVNCRENEEYTQCVNPCNDCENKGKCQYSCEAGCDCKKGFYRDEYDICKQHEEYLLCGSACPQTCENYRQRIICTQQCLRGCFCKAGYVRALNGTCVLPRDCPNLSRGALFMKYITYANHNVEIRVKRFNSTSGACPNVCVSGCFCQNGYVKRKDGLCVRPNECPLRNTSICPLREVPYECIPTCRTSCDTLSETDAVCTRECRAGCFCSYNEVRNASGSCIPIRDCPPRLSSNSSNASIQFRRKNTDGEDNETTSHPSTTLNTEKQSTGIPFSSKAPNPTSIAGISSADSLVTTNQVLLSTEQGSTKPLTTVAPESILTTGKKEETLSTKLAGGSSIPALLTTLLTTKTDTSTEPIGTTKEESNSSINTKKDDTVLSSTEKTPCHDLTTKSLSTVAGITMENVTTGTEGKTTPPVSDPLPTGTTENLTTI
ncbi:SCO-spondin-like [Uloborus diversus]|uniref:SCO-spondin-like n=1 Tax=Uloborus diversus TaxID=327109 RepID=UPI00240A521B|nr:SCO-spondin-like [Uloborus diversus]